QGQLGARLGSISNYLQFLDNQIMYQIEWVFRHPEGQLWISQSNIQQIRQIQVNQDNWQAVRRVVSFANGGANQPYDAVVHDGHNLWQGGYALANFRIYDDGVAEVYWLGFEPTEGTIEAGGDVNIIVTLNAAGLVEGDYEGELHITSNDPDEGDVVVSVLLGVTGAPDIEGRWAAAYGYPNVVDWNRRYADLFNGGQYAMTINVRNVGTADLVVDGTEFTDGAYSINRDQFALAPREAIDLTVTLATDESGDHDATMTFITNDPDEGEYVINLHGRTGEPPQIALDPQAIEDDLNTGEMSEHVVNVANNGEAPLRFRIAHEIIREPGQRRDAGGREMRDANGGPLRDNPGDLIAQFNQPQGAGVNIYCSPVGYDMENNLAAITIYNTSTVAIWTHDNYQNFREVRRFATPNPMDGGFYNGVIYICNLNVNNVLRRFDMNGNQLQDMAMGFPIYGVAFDHEEGWLFAKEQAGQQPVRVYRMDGNNLGQQIGTIANWAQHAQGNVNVYSLEWVSKHPDGKLWIHQGANTNLFNININTDNWQSVGQVRSFPVGITQPYDAVMHDGYNIWVGGWGPGTIRIYDDGVAEAYWLIYDPRDGEIESGGDMNVVVTLDGTGLVTGDYEADMHFLSNDPNDGDLALNVLLHVTGVPVVDAIWPGAYGHPDVVDWNRAFQDIFAGGPYNVTVRVENVGTDVLEVSDISIDSEAFSANPVEFQLDPRGRQNVVFTFNAEEPGEYDATATIISNAPANDGQYNIALHARAFAPPSINLDPQGIETDLVTGDIEEHVVNVSNSGDALLRWETDVEIIREPEGGLRRDASGRELRNADGGPRRDDPGDLIAQFN
ncbi:MAG: choice-of-anchor D domain-containing protein, partial [Calditrichaeota bacterium]|nr:choice-of-anchor D domain-containing protein [Calditrichota bacterium]